MLLFLIGVIGTVGYFIGKYEYKKFKIYRNEKRMKGRRVRIADKIIGFNKKQGFLDYIKNNECVICLEYLAEGDDIRNFECNRHMVHIDCYNAWR